MTDLAERIEGAEGPSRELDAEIAAAVRHFPKGVGFVWQHELKPNSPEQGRVECCTSLGTGGPHYKAPSYTASIDAAMTLVPENAFWWVGMRGANRGGYEACCQIEGDLDWRFGATPALALCAAALRARGAGDGE